MKATIEDYYEVIDIVDAKEVKPLVYRGKTYEEFMVTEDGNIISYKEKYPKLKRQYINKDGYPSVFLCKQYSTALVHQIVAETFIGVKPDGMIVLHYDDIKTNNHYSNLRYGTPKDNSNDYKRNKNKHLIDTKCNIFNIL